MTQFDEYIAIKRDILQLENAAAEYEEKIQLVFGAITTQILRDPENETNIRSVYEPRIEYLQNKMLEKVSLSDQYILIIIACRKVVCTRHFVQQALKLLFFLCSKIDLTN